MRSWATVVNRPRYHASALILLALSGGVTPADGASLAVPPVEVSVAIPAGGVRDAHLAVATSEGVDVTAGPAVMRDGALVVPVRIVDPGTYLVAFHLVLADGRVDSAVTRFGVGVQPVGHSMAHAHSDPLNLALTAIAAILVLASLYILLSPWPRRKPGTPRRY